ncbi:hypothetical protein AVEN_103234-1 [Araneus ventricosus]|uniref:Uncharacterized protein n=1 Tax=Araneus ventricosus TaxID=182803 RepID=A0A4Y2ECJ0_ARAVE|nr:hypothetical protein AVEN_103234-1 [Araneus ventricosus]
MRLSGLQKWAHITPPINPLLSKIVQKGQSSDIETEGLLRKRKRFFDEKYEDESSEISRHKKFKLALLQVNDRIEAELERRFQSMQKLNEIFGILVSKQLMTLDNKILREKATT